MKHQNLLSASTPLIPSQEERRAAGRPVLTQSQVTELTKRILSMTTADTAAVYVTHTASVITRLADDRVLLSNDGDTLDIAISTSYGVSGEVFAHTNQITESTLRAVVEQCEGLARDQLRQTTKVVQPSQVADAYVPVHLWHDTTVSAMTTPTLRDTTVPALLAAVQQRGLRAAGFVGLMARVRSMLTREGITSFCEETDTEVTMTARTPDAKSSGWAGQAARDWSKIDCPAIANRAAQLALDGRGVQALEPGRRTAILSSAAVAQIMRFFAKQFDAFATDMGNTGFSKPGGGGNRLHQKIFDPRIQMSSDPADPEGGYNNAMKRGHASIPMTWVKDGVLKNLAYSADYGIAKGKAYTENPYSLRIGGGPASVDEMIASCEEGIYVNRLSDVTMLEERSGMMTGVTRDGCFLVKHGKIDRPVKNFRFLSSPFFMLNNLIALGKTERAPFGYTPPTDGEYDLYYYSWPRWPIIVPPMMVRDFNFNSLVDAV